MFNVRNINFLPVLIISVFMAGFFCGCRKQLSLEEKASQDAREYNRRYCPTPTINCIRTDSINFNPSKHVFTYNCSFCGVLDDPVIVELNKDRIIRILTNSVKESTSMKAYVESGYHFRYVCHSDSLPQTVLFEIAF